jgi:HEAT repeat protein
MKDPDRDLAQAAQESFFGLAGPEVETMVTTLLTKGEAGIRTTALEIIGQQRMKSALPAVIKAVGDQDANVRSKALGVLGEVAGVKELPLLADLLLEAQAPEVVRAAEQAISTVCARAKKPEAASPFIVSRLEQAPSGKKVALLGVLSKVGGTTALKAVRSSVQDPQTEVHAAAIRALSVWKSPEVVPDLLALAQTAQDPTDRLLGLRSYLGWAGKEEVPLRQRLEICRKAAGLVQKPEDKTLLISRLGNVASPESLTLLLPYLDEPATRDEGINAMVSVAEKLLNGRQANRVAPRLIQPLEKAVKVATNPGLAERAKAVLKLAKDKVK